MVEHLSPGVILASGYPKSIDTRESGFQHGRSRGRPGGPGGRRLVGPVQTPQYTPGWRFESPVDLDLVAWRPLCPLKDF